MFNVIMHNMYSLFLVKNTKRNDLELIFLEEKD